jgi:hypothetical protein
MATTVQTALDSESNFVVTPRRYQEMPLVYYSNSNGGALETNNLTIDTAGLSNTASWTTTVTIRFGTDYMTTAPTTGTQTGFQYVDQFRSAGTSYFPQLQHALVNNVHTIIAGGFGQNFSTTFNNFNSLRNTWLTMIVSTATASTAFANWDGPATGSLFIRIAVVNVETGQLIQQSDGVLPSVTVITKDFGQTWELSSTANYGYSPAIRTGDSNNWSLYSRSDWDLASVWHGWAVIDPAVYWPQLSGSGLNHTVNGIKATALILFDSAGTSVTGGFTIDVSGLGSRLPAGTLYSANNNQGNNTNAPVLTSF